MESDGIKLVEVNEALDSRGRALRFPPRIEDLYCEHLRSYRRKLAWAMLPATLVVYNLYLLVDLFLLPETFRLATAIHLLVVTPLIVATTFVVARSRRPALRDLVAGLVPCAMVTQIMVVYALAESAAAEHYQYLAIMILVFMNIIYKLDHRNTVIATCAVGLIYVAGLVYRSPGADVLIIGPMVFAAAAFLTLTAHRRMEKDARFAFLRRLQDSLRRQEAEIEACRDSLTGLFNRRRLDQLAEQLWKDSDGDGDTVAIIVLDIDHFKNFNDRYGHLVGDLCLKKVGEMISASVRVEGELPVRFGGEEFIVLLPRTSLPDAIRRAERLRRAVEELAIPHETSVNSDLVTASFGVMSGPVSEYTLQDLIQGADQALYAAKRAGRNRVWPPLVQDSAPPQVLDLKSFRASA